MRHIRPLISCVIAVLAAALTAGCADDSELPPNQNLQSHTVMFRGAFAGPDEAGGLFLTFDRPSPWPLAGHLASRTLGPAGNSPATVVPVGGVATWDGVSMHAVGGTYDIEKDSITFSANGYTFSGHFDYMRSQLVGQIVGSHAGTFQCVFDDHGDVEVYCGEWAIPGAPTLGYVGFLATNGRIVGSMITRIAVAPFFGYRIDGEIQDGDPLRAITASGRSHVDSLSLGGYADTSVDTAGGWWETISDFGVTTTSGWWHAVRFRPTIDPNSPHASVR